ncbi:hypothetical protein DP116_03315 [Brasilonema bromeliae SPC951]|uniref:Transposase n=1 Tax=Brasilonema bromeliae SPC951 TaxID=385972 RepID=A0ABX1P4Q8_9CYAN|nr:hypothetical protein [Brasilonema bromeliae SPC951]
MYVGYRAWGDFVKRHRCVLISTFGIQKHGVPSYSTIRRILMGVDFDTLAATFNQWAQNYVHLETWEWCGIDGDALSPNFWSALFLLICVPRRVFVV